MLRDTLSIGDILIGFENALRIDYKQPHIADIIRSSRERLENTYRVKLTNGVYAAQIENRLLGESISTLIAQVTENLKSLSLLMSVSMFDKEYGQTIGDVNYLGFPKVKLTAALKYLQDKTLYEKRVDFFKTLVAAIDSVEICTVKRLFTVMAVLEDLKISDGVAVIAQYLYVGGL